LRLRSQSLAKRSKVGTSEVIKKTLHRKANHIEGEATGAVNLDEREDVDR